MRRGTLSLAGFILICFFFPWMQLSCVGMKDSVSGFDLARGNDKVLWFVPVLMIAVLVLGSVRMVWERFPAIFALSGTVGGSISTYLMYREHSLNRSSMIIASQWTPIFWLGFAASIGVTITAFMFFFGRSKAP